VRLPIRSTLCVAVSAAFLVAPTTSVRAQAVDAEALMSRVEKANQLGSQALVFRYDQFVEIHAGAFMNESDAVSYVVAATGGDFVAVRVVRMTKNGKDASAADRTSAETDFLKSRHFANPYDERYARDYADTVEGDSMHFQAKVRDARHGDGVIFLDAAGHVTRMTYTPCVLPDMANRGSVEIRRAQTLPGVWQTVEYHGTYSGRRLLVSGSLHVDATVSDVRAYPSGSAAQAAVQAAAST
jgi:hypothetical protein